MSRALSNQNMFKLEEHINKFKKQQISRQLVMAESLSLCGSKRQRSFESGEASGSAQKTGWVSGSALSSKLRSLKLSLAESTSACIEKRIKATDESSN